MARTPPAFTRLIDLAAARLGGEALCASDEFFAPRENLLRATEPVFLPDEYTEHGKWMDGWESRRRREPGHDWCLLRLGLRGVVHGVDVDTRHFTGNFPESCSLEACDLAGSPSRKALLAAPWEELVPERRLRGDGHNWFATKSRVPWTHLRLNILPDGGVARLRVHGEVVPDWEALERSRRLVDLVAVANGGRALAASDEHYGRMGNLILPGESLNMGDGWETRRRRGPGHDWVILRLGRSGRVHRLVIETEHYKGNYPGSCSVQGLLRVREPSLESLQRARWQTVLQRCSLRANSRHEFAVRELERRGPFSHLRLCIYPDGGISRVRAHGRLAEDQ